MTAQTSIQYLPRLAEAHLQAVASVQPVVAVQGARQTGKSTLVRHHPALREHLYLSMDAPDVREQALRDPAGLLARAPRLILDEVQRAPDLLIAVKEAVDLDPARTPGRFVLTGSANLLALRKVTESLAGRASYTSLWPLARRERLGLGTAGAWDALLDAPMRDWPEVLAAQDLPAEDWRMAAARSAYPTPALRLANTDAQAIWLDGYVDTYIDRDVAELAQIAMPLDLRRLMGFVCASIGQIERQTAWGQAAGMKRSTVSRYLDLLETSYQLVRLPAYAVNRTKRLTKSPKVYWSDTAMALHLTKERAPTGFHFENLVVGDLLVWSAGRSRRPGLFHWRTVDQQEVDIVAELPDGRLLAIEVKSAVHPGWTDVAGLRLFLEEYPEAIGGLVLHGGTETYALAERIVCAPWWRVL